MHHFKPNRLGGAVKVGEEEDDQMNEWVTLFVEQPLALPEYAKYAKNVSPLILMTFNFKICEQLKLN